MRTTYYRGVKPSQVWVEEWETGGGGLPGERMKVRRLDPRPDLYECYGDVNWGRYDRGAAKLAVSILADTTGNDRLALALYAEFARRFVAGWGERWRISADSVRSWAASQADALTPEGDEEELIDAREAAPYERR